MDAKHALGLRLTALSIGQVISWGILYYALIVAAPAIADDMGWSLATITLSFSAGLVISAAAGILVGRWLDDRGPRLIMTIGAVIGSVGLVVVSTAPDLIIFTLGWTICGLAQAAVLYQAAFTVIARRHGESRRSAMTILTLAGGLASTLFAPIVAGLLSILDWRALFLLLAATLLVLSTPLHWFFLERSWAPLPAAHEGETVHTVGAVIQTRRFWMLEISMVTLTAALFSVTLAVIPLYMEKGLTYELAAWALGLLGAGQVIGRLIYVAIPQSAEPWIPLAVTSALSVIALGLMGALPGPPWFLVVVGIFAGAVRGAQTLVQGSAVADRWGTRNYGSINGTFAAPITAVTAIGPALGPVVATAVGGYAPMALVMAVLAIIAVITSRLS